MGKVITLGEIMLRLSTECGIRLSQANHFQAHYGGGEANVAASLATFGHEVYYASKVPDNSLGDGVKKHLQANGVHTSYLLYGGSRLGTYYMESGSGERATSVIYDRAGSSFATMESLEWDLTALFTGIDIFHISGITPALSENWKKWTITLVKAAKKANVKVSFDINYRGKLWSQKEASETIKQILPYVDYCSAGKMDALYLLDVSPFEDEENELIYYYQEMQKLFPTISVFYSTKRVVHSASSNELTGTLWINESFYESATHYIQPIVDRVGGGDAFAAGVLHGLLKEELPQRMVDFATAASALKHTVYGDANPFYEKEIAAFLEVGSGKIIR